MRIIAGTHRGRHLLVPSSDTTRPYTDRVKQSVFDVLAPLLANATVYDVFAGTGSMGLECLSRDSRHATFFEADRSALALLRRNITDLGLGDRAVVRPGDLFAWFKRKEWKLPPPPSRRADLIFLDPPYRYLRECTVQLLGLSHVMAKDHLAADGTLVFRHDAADAITFDQLNKYDERAYGDMVVEFLTPLQYPTNNP